MLNKEVINKNTSQFICIKNNLEHLHIYSFAVKNNSLINLMLQFNNISELNIYIFVNLTRLHIINLSNNSLKSISKSLFKYNQNLNLINLSNNKLIYFYLILDNFHKLATIYLHNNKLSTFNRINYGSFINGKSNKYDSKIRYIDISGNQFNCDKNMTWVNQLRKTIYIKISLNTTYCKKLVNTYNITLGSFLGIRTCGITVSDLINC